MGEVAPVALLAIEIPRFNRSSGVFQSRQTREILSGASTRSEDLGLSIDAGRCGGGEDHPKAGVRQPLGHGPRTKACDQNTWF